MIAQFRGALALRTNYRLGGPSDANARNGQSSMAAAARTAIALPIGRGTVLSVRRIIALPLQRDLGWAYTSLWRLADPSVDGHRAHLPARAAMREAAVSMPRADAAFVAQPVRLAISWHPYRTAGCRLAVSRISSPVSSSPLTSLRA